MIVEIFFQYKSAKYKAFTLRQSPEELFLHFSYSNKDRKRLNLDSGEIIRRTDHFSWHIDGEAISRSIRSKKFKKERFPMEYLYHLLKEICLHFLYFLTSKEKKLGKQSVAIAPLLHISLKY